MMLGVCVRDVRGRTGRVRGLTDAAVKIAWEADQLRTYDEEIPIDSSALRYEIEALTLDAGWLPFASVPRVPLGGKQLGESCERPRGRNPLVEDLERLLEATKHYPFAFKSNLGPGPRGGSNKEALKWACRCSNYVCKCKGQGGTKKTVRIDKAYKKKYNKDYRAWRKGRED